METFRLALLELNPKVGDIHGNIDKIRQARAKAGQAGADLVLTCELATCGYPPEDLVLKPVFMMRLMEAVEALADESGPDLLLSTPWQIEGKLVSAVLLIESGRISQITLKHDLPNYGPFDEKRVFMAGPLPEPLTWRGIHLGVPICEDVWTPKVCAHLAARGAEILISPNGSPYEYGKAEVRRNLVLARAKETGLAMAYVNQVGGQDELAFDGGALIGHPDGTLVGESAHWCEDVILTDWSKGPLGWRCVAAPHTRSEDYLGNMYAALVVGLRDYVQKNGFPSVVLGMSGGVDSALCAAIAADALGPERVRCVMMPSPYTAQISLDDASACARALGCPYESMSIAPAMAAFEGMLKHPTGVTAENIQARARGMLLMALSNSTGAMVISTGNKSEMSVGYATLYGDMCGGFAVIKDVYKMKVYALCTWRNQNTLAFGLGPKGPVIPERILTRAPSAELRPDQTDQDSLPAYPVLDAIVEGIIEREMSPSDLVTAGYDEALVRKIWQMIDRAEYKRRQSAPGVKITPRSFGKDRRYPITNGFEAL